MEWRILCLCTLDLEYIGRIWQRTTLSALELFAATQQHVHWIPDSAHEAPTGRGGKAKREACPQSCQTGRKAPSWEQHGEWTGGKGDAPCKWITHSNDLIWPVFLYRYWCSSVVRLSFTETCDNFKFIFILFQIIN